MSVQRHFKNKKICVVGDLMLDRYLYGDVERISDEAPVPIVKVIKETLFPGGAGNVASNITSLGGKPFLIGLIGEDSAGKALVRELSARNIPDKLLVKSKNVITTEKIRIIGRNQQIVRIDKEPSPKVYKFETNLFQLAVQTLKISDALIFSDYLKGCITEALAKKIIKLAAELKKPVVVDTKPPHKLFYSGVTVITPNHKESAIMTGETGVRKAGLALKQELSSPILITEGSNGMTLFEKNSITHLPTMAKEVFDVTGAGDTVVATVALGLASGYGLEKSAIIANYAAGIVVGKIGTASVSPKELDDQIHDNSQN